MQLQQNLKSLEGTLSMICTPPIACGGIEASNRYLMFGGFNIHKLLNISVVHTDTYFSRLCPRLKICEEIDGLFSGDRIHEYKYSRH